MKNKAKNFSIVVLLFIAVVSMFAGDVKAESYGWSPQVDFSNQGPPKCTDSQPDKAPSLLQPNHPVLPKKAKNGEVVLYWHKVPGATGYNIYYGLTPKNYIYSAVNIGDTGNFTVGYLPNKTFYFAVQALKGCAAGALSQEWSGRPGGVGYSANNSVLGLSYNVVPVRKPVVEAEVMGVDIEPRLGDANQQENTVAVAYEPPPQEIQPTAIPSPVTQPVKKTNLWQNILSIFFKK